MSTTGIFYQFILKKKIKVKKYDRVKKAALTGKEVYLNNGDILISFDEEVKNTVQTNQNKSLDVPLCSLFNYDKYYLVPVDAIRIRKPVKLAKHPWYFGAIEKSLTIELFKNSQIGSFLIRNSQSNAQFLVLDVNIGNELSASYYIAKNNNGYFINPQIYFKSINRLLQFYMNQNHGTIVHLLNIPNRNSLAKNLFNMEFLTNNWQLNSDHVLLGKTIDEGQFGVVRTGRYMEHKVAIKSIKNEEKHIDSFLTELGFMTFLNHENIVSFLGVHVDGNMIYSVQELCQNGSLIGYLQTQGKESIKASFLYKTAKQVLMALTYLESMKLVHRDISARNILLTENLTAKVTDFGLITTEYNFGTHTDLPLRWTAPEIIEFKIHSTFSDVWSFGILLWEMFSFGRNPYPKWNNEDILESLKKGKRMDPPADCPPAIADIMSRCWNIVPNKRPTFQTLLQEISKLCT